MLLQAVHQLRYVFSVSQSLAFDILRHDHEQASIEGLQVYNFHHIVLYS